MTKDYVDSYIKSRFSKKGGLMSDMIRGHILATGPSSIPTVDGKTLGTQEISFIKIKTPKGNMHLIRNVVLPLEIVTIIEDAMDHGHLTELWLAGRESKPLVYAIRTENECYYTNSVSSGLYKDALKFFLIGIPTMLFLCAGLLFWAMSIFAVIAAMISAAKYTEEQFIAGWEKGVLKQVDPVPELSASTVT
ncbi:hypothetical protein [Methylobacterium sp. 174MFSha1.1]|uniref:hypothetical protein n=1 Tax=Methylobacterium sp. 174MFSha1.1 TaxID=1502749 RepID=UPI001160D0FC|nr:hypothetical protein [Methylobacterium sp. 174MFSha1.1]